MMRVELSSSDSGAQVLEGQPRYVAYQIERMTGERLTEGRSVTVTVLHVDKSRCNSCGEVTPDELIPARKATKRRAGTDEHVVCAVCGIPR